MQLPTRWKSIQIGGYPVAHLVSRFNLQAYLSQEFTIVVNSAHHDHSLNLNPKKKIAWHGNCD